MMAKRILVPLETSEHAESVLPLVADLARAGGATVRLLHVTPYARTRFSEDNRVIRYAHQQEERDARDAELWLRQLTPPLDGIAAEHSVRIGEPGEEILQEAAAFNADVIVLRASPWRWWRRTLGRIAKRVRANAEVPVLLLSEAAS
jgi:nucleotide-binding universal stress UspA family protein